MMRNVAIGAVLGFGLVVALLTVFNNEPPPPEPSPAPVAEPAPPPPAVAAPTPPVPAPAAPAEEPEPEPEPAPVAAAQEVPDASVVPVFEPVGAAPIAMPDVKMKSLDRARTMRGMMIDRGQLMMQPRMVAPADAGP